jgi:hypothetical protein
VGNPEGKTPLGRLECGWINIIKTEIGEIGWGGMD